MLRNLKLTFFCLLAFCLSSMTVFAAEKQPDTRAAEAAGAWMSEGTMFVLYADLEELKLRESWDSMLAVFQSVFKRTMEEDQVQTALGAAEMFLTEIEKRIETVKNAGGRDLFIFAEPNGAASPIFAVLPLSSEDAEAVSAVENILKGFPAVSPEQEAAMETVLHSGQVNGAVVFAVTLFPLDEETKKDYVAKYFAEKKTAPNEKLMNALSFSEGNALNLAFGMTEQAKSMIPAILAPMRDRNELGLSIPKAFVIEEGLDAVLLSADVYDGVLKLTVVSKNEKAANRLMRLYDRWYWQILENVEKEMADSESIQRAIMMDMVELYLEMFRPVQEENRLVWDVNEMNARFPLMNFASTPMLGVTAGLLLPAVQQAREAARTMQHSNNFKQVSLAMLNFESVTQSYPAPFTTDTEGKPLHSWRVQLLPFLEENTLYQQIRHDEPWDSEWNSQFHDLCPACFKDPRLELAPSEATIGVVVGENTMFRDPGPAKRMPNRTGRFIGGTRMGEVRDGVSNTILTVECKPVCWMDPSGDPTWEEVKKGPPVSRNGMTKIGMADGSVQVIRDSIDQNIWKCLLERNDGEPVSVPFD